MYDVDPSELIEKVTEKLKTMQEIKPPEWAAFVKTGVSKERPPLRKDWWYVRAASILRKVYRFGPIGVSKLRTKYGSKKNRGVKPEHFYKGSGSIIRKTLQQLENAGLLQKVEKGIRKGKVITPKGKSLLDKTAAEILGRAKGTKIKGKSGEAKSL
jgi:small subunit ribosomal protein S19e